MKLKVLYGFVLIIIVASALIFGALPDSVISASAAGIAPTDSTPSKTVLLVKGNSYWEKTVGTLVVEKLTARGFTVVVANIKNVSVQNPRMYAYTILFGAVETQKRLSPEARTYVTVNGGSLSNILIARVFGQAWNPKEKTVDAVTTATKSLDPEVVSDKIVTQVVDNSKKKQ